MSKEMDVRRLIDEVRIRPALWDNLRENSPRTYIAKQWKQVAAVLGVDDVEQCRVKWKHLRDVCRALVRRTNRRMERDKVNGIFHPKRSYDSKWTYFEAMSFIKDSKRRRRRLTVESDQNTNSTDDFYHPQLLSACEIKTDQIVSGDDEIYSIDDDEYDDMDDDILFEEFQSIPTPPVLSINLPAATTLRVISMEQNPRTEPSEQQPSLDNAAGNNDLRLEEETLVQSTQQTTKCSSDHAADPDYNFLISFLPQMKKMSDFQNLQFRARMCDMVLNILAPSSSVSLPSAPPSLTAGPAIAQLQSRGQPALTVLQQPHSSVFHCSGDGRRSEEVTINAATSTSCNLRP